MVSNSWAVSSSLSLRQEAMSPAPTKMTSPPGLVRGSVEVAVGASLSLKISINCGGCWPSREEKTTPSLLSAMSTKLNVPGLVTRDVTSYSTQLFVLRLSLLSTALLAGVGRFSQVMPASSHELLVAYTAGPSCVPLSVTYKRSRALWIGPDTSATRKRTKLSTPESLAPSARNVVPSPKFVVGSDCLTRASASATKKVDASCAGAVLVNVAEAEMAVAVAVTASTVGVGPSANVMTSSGGWLPWREENVAASLLSAASTKLNVPLPVTALVTSYSTQLSLLMLP